MNKVSIIGSGYVGATTAFALALDSDVTDIVLVDINRDKAEGDALDISHAVPLLRPIEVYAGDFSDVVDSKIIIITAGANQSPGETRLDLVKRNTEIFKEILPKLLKYNSKAIYLIVTNPVDILTYVTYKLANLPFGKVIGSGTVLDSARFRQILSKHYQIDPRNIHGYIIGEHGDSEIAAWSLTNIAGASIDYYCKICEHPCNEQFKADTLNKVSKAAYHIINKKGATYYAVAVAVRRIVEAIFRDEKSILSVSSPLSGQYGIFDVALSLPSIVGKNGVERILELQLNQVEIEGLKNSANILKNVLKEIGI